MQQQAEAAKQELQKINAECTELEKKESDLKEKEVDVKHDLQQCENLHKENSAKLKFHKDKVCVSDSVSLESSRYFYGRVENNLVAPDVAKNYRFPCMSKS